ncbi:DUF452 family protein [Rhodobacteraceae bacterium M382]|nr:DUF452 family protein [Rhodobacteraceae bacterium M382]
MREEWISRTGAKRVLVVFGGWAIGPDPFVHLAQDCDLLFVSDYRELDWTPKGLDAYEERILLAWSFGVAGYAHWQDGRADPFTRKIAVNGTLTPADRRMGIPPMIYSKTQTGLSAESFQSFVARVFDAPQPPLQIDIAARQAELAAVQSRATPGKVMFHRVWISTGDRIFPPANLDRAWAGQSSVIRYMTDAPHAPFDRFDRVEALWT